MIHSRDYEVLRTSTGYICMDTGAMLTDLSKKYYALSSGDKERFPKVYGNSISRQALLFVYCWQSACVNTLIWLICCMHYAHIARRTDGFTTESSSSPVCFDHKQVMHCQSPVPVVL